MSGHSKWSQVKHKKALTDAKKGTLFSKMVREITIAARVGGSSLDANIRLKAAADRGKAIGLPKDTIERAISRGAGGGADGELYEFLYEANASGGVAILIEGITDSKNRSFAEIRHVLSLHGGKIADPGSVAWAFEKIGVIAIDPASFGSRDADTIELALIEAGAHHIERGEEEWLVETAFTDLERTRRVLEQDGIAVKQSDHDYKCRSPLALSPGSSLPSSLLEALEEHDDVQEIYTNLAAE